MTLENLLYNNNIHVIFLFVDFILELLKNKVFSEPGSSSLTKEKFSSVTFWRKWKVGKVSVICCMFGFHPV